MLIGAIGCLGTPGAIAQDTAADDEDIEEVVVTGSRIKRSGIDAPTPVTVLNSEVISLAGEVNLANLLNQLPALGSTFTNASSSGFIGTVGLSFLDLRRLGRDRTLVLVDGRRHVGGSAGEASVDINSIPQELIERVEVVTGGASAIYGADAVSGVVNFVMKDDYEGLSLYGQVGNADEGDSFSYTTRGIMGGNFADGRGNAVMTFEYSSSDGFIGNDRSYRRENLRFVDNPANGDTLDNPNDGIPDEILLPDIGLDFITIGGIFDDFGGNTLVVENGQFRPFDTGSQVFAGGDQQGGDALRTSDIAGSLQADLERIITTAKINYQVNDNMNAFIEAKYINAKSFALNGTGAFDIFSISIGQDYAFLTDDQRQFMVDNNINTLFVSRSHNEAERNSRAERQLFRGVAGIEGDFDNGIAYELSYVYGRSTNAIQQGNNRINARFSAGLDAVIDPATGQAVCRSSIDPAAAEGIPDFALNGCVPINILGEGAISQEAINFAYADAFVNESLEQNVINLAFTGDTADMGFELPAGGISWATGFEYRKETASSVPSEIDQLGLTFLNVIPPTGGSFDVYEGFAEVSIPLLKDTAFAKHLSVDGAVRISDYSTVGSATTWKVGMNWAPIDDLRFRGTFGRAIRAPNIAELFGPQSQTFLFFDDPCDVDFLDEGGANRAANCAALGAPDGFQQDDTRGNTPGTTGGNPNVGEETADTLTIGMVYTPSWAQGLSLTLDYWDIEIESAISTPTLDDVLSNCVDGASIDNSFCSLITRDPNTFQVETFTITNQNFAALEARGIDFEVNYLWNLESAGAIDFRAIGTYLIERNDFPFQVQPDFVDEEAGELGDPEWSINFNATWNYEKWSFNYEMRFIDDMLIVEIDELEADPDLQDVTSTGTTFFHDIRVGYELRDNIELFAGVNNLTQEFPPVGLSGAGTDSAIFDNIGRFYYTGLRVDF